MKKLLPFLFLTFFVFHLQAQSVEGNGKLKSEARTVPSFTGLSISGGFEVVLTQGAKGSLTLEADENVLPHITSEVINGVLQIKVKGIKNAKRMKVYVTVPTMESLELAGGIKLTSTNTISGDMLKMELAGGISLEMDIKVKELRAEVAGGTSTTLSGSADKVVMEMAGASSLKAVNLKTNYFTIEAAGVGNAEVNVAKELTVDAAGLVNVDYKGSPKINHSGMGKVRPM